MAATSSILNADYTGAFASALCAVHCMATPFLFVAQTCSVSGCCETSPAWWSGIDYAFVGITLVAVIIAARKSGYLWMKAALFGAWAVLTALVFNEAMEVVVTPSSLKYVAAFSLIGLHLYNRKYCCTDEGCEHGLAIGS